jgi:hypothetical protein
MPTRSGGKSPPSAKKSKSRDVTPKACDKQVATKKTNNNKRQSAAKQVRLKKKNNKYKQEHNMSRWLYSKKKEWLEKPTCSTRQKIIICLNTYPFKK